MLPRQQMLDVLRSGGSIGLPDGRHVLSEADLPPEEDLAALLRRMSGHHTRGAERALQAGNRDEAARLQDMARSYDLMAADRDAESVEEIEKRQAELETRKQRVIRAREAATQDAPQGPQDAPGSRPVGPDPVQARDSTPTIGPQKAPEPSPPFEAATTKPGRFGRRPAGEE